MTDRAFRLPLHLRPEHYAIHLALNLDAWSFTGKVEIDLQLDQPTSTIELHALDLEVETADVVQEGRHLRLEPSHHLERQTVALRASQPLRPGPARLEVGFRGTIGDELIGLYRGHVGEDRYALTQCEPTYARRIFPCFDEPAFKARFTLSVQLPEGLEAVSNEPITEEHPGAQPGTRLVTFQTTPRMSTYLFALAVGRMEGSPVTRTASGVPVCVWTVPGKVGLADFALEAAAASLDRLESYFGILYPYGKLDLLAVPAFEAGAMENSGAVFFRERRLLCDRAAASLENRKSIALVIAHELAHQWFGNLVTMKWWDDLWLNEAFASWMEHVVIDDWQPDWKVWIDFQQSKAAPFYTDSLASTRAIRAQVDSAEQISEMFDAITYEKGAAVLRMLEQYLSPPVFRDGVRGYLREHLEGNASADHLFGALGVASAQPIREVAADWIDQPGYPLLSTRLVDGRSQQDLSSQPSDAGARSNAPVLELRQRRFFLDPAQPEAGQRWRVPVVVRYRADAKTYEQRMLVEGTENHLRLDPPGPIAWLTANAGENGFYRVRYDHEQAEKLISSLFEAMEPPERVGFVGNQWALCRAGAVDPADFLDLLRALQPETARAVVETLVERLAFFRSFLVETDHLPAFAALVESLLRPALEELGWSPTAGEDDETRLRRAAVVRGLGAIARADDVVTQARHLLQQHWSAPGSVDSNLLDALAGIAAHSGDEGLFQAYLERYQHGATPEEQFRHLLGLAAFEEPALAGRALSLTLTPTVQTQDVGMLLARLLSNPAAKEMAWSFVQENWQSLSHRLPPLLVRRVVQALPNLGTAEARRQVERFFAAHPLPEAQRTLRQALEELDLLVAFRQRAIPAVREYLAGARH